MIMQSAVLGVGGYLVIMQEASAGIIIAGAILSSRALAPVELAIANWKGFVAARQGWSRLRQLASQVPPPSKPTPLPAPAQVSRGRGRERTAIWRAADRGAGDFFSAERGSGARHHRPERRRQVLSGPCDRRGVVA